MYIYMTVCIYIKMCSTLLIQAQCILRQSDQSYNCVTGRWELFFSSFCWSLSLLVGNQSKPLLLMSKYSAETAVCMWTVSNSSAFALRYPGKNIVLSKSGVRYGDSHLGFRSGLGCKLPTGADGL